SWVVQSSRFKVVASYGDLSLELFVGKFGGKRQNGGNKFGGKRQKYRNKFGGKRFLTYFCSGNNE
ncbi:MAG: hypothetical protein HUK20_09865, partial [Fibrobacter sp.]|nr:hypothetical protein [Fibrobacter sp.]